MEPIAKAMPEQDPLALLRDIHLPDAVSAWPPAPGWWLLAALLLTLLAIIAITLYRRHQRNRYRRQALKALAALTAYKNDNHSSAYLQQLNALLKQTALAALQHASATSSAEASIASLSGKSWLQFLDRSMGTRDFSEGAGSVLCNGPYQATPATTDIKTLQQLSRRWIRRHRIPC